MRYRTDVAFALTKYTCMTLGTLCMLEAASLGTAAAFPTPRIVKLDLEIRCFAPCIAMNAGPK